MSARAHDREQAERLARGFAADVKRQQEATRALAARLGGTVQPPSAGQHQRRTLAEIVRDSGFSDAGELDAVLRIDGRAYR